MRATALRIRRVLGPGCARARDGNTTDLESPDDFWTLMGPGRRSGGLWLAAASRAWTVDTVLGRAGRIGSRHGAERCRLRGAGVGGLGGSN